MSNLTLSWSFLVSNTESESEMFSETQPNRGSQKYTSYFTWQVENKLFKGSVFMNEWQPNSPGCEDRSEWQCCKTRLQWLTDVAFHSAHQKGYQSKLLFFHSKGSSQGLLHRSDQRLPSWASHNRLQYDCSCSDTPSWLVWILTVMPGYIFHNSCFFLFEIETLYTIQVLAVFDFYYRT